MKHVGKMTYPPRCPHHAPEKVMNIDAFSEWEKMEKKALEQRQCPDCLRWLFRGEFGRGWAKGYKHSDIGRIYVEVTKANLNPDAKRHEFETVGQIFDAATEENVEAIAKVISDSLRHFVALRAIDPTLELDRLTWIDD